MIPPNYSRRSGAALILSSDMLGAALLGAAIELHGYRAVYPRGDEGGADALRRLKPRVVLVDAGGQFLSDTTVIGPALMTRAHLVFFGSPERIRDLRVLASKYDASLLALPDDVDKLPQILSRPPQKERLPGR